MRPEQNGSHGAHIKMHFLKKTNYVLIQISLYGSICIKLALFQVMAWCLFGTKPFLEPILAMFYFI